MRNKQSWASFSPIRTGIVLNFVGEFSSPLLRCPLLTLHIIQMRTPAASVPGWLEALGSVTELSPLELSLTAPLTTHPPAVSAWVGLCVSFHNLHHLFLYVLCAQAWTREKLTAILFLLMQSLWGTSATTAGTCQGSVLSGHRNHVPSQSSTTWLSIPHSTSLISVLFPSFRLPGAFATTMLTCLPWGWKFFLTKDPN